jgi:hypothetical protein
MLDDLLERGLYAAMAAVLIVPELGTFLVFFGLALGILVFAGRLVWTLVRDTDDHSRLESAQPEPVASST